jgi:ABC-type transport system involved in multi-copper enzyme maturation permease subunit
MKILAVAHTTLREALRERLMYNLAVFAVLLIVGSLTVSQLTLGEQFRIIADIGTSATQVFGTLIAVFLGVALVSREIDRRTCYAVLARPLSRAGFVLGKFLGLLAVLAINVVVMAAALAAILHVYRGSLAHLDFLFFATFGLLLVQLALAGAFAVLFAVLSSSTLATILTLTVVAAGHLFGEVRGFWLKSPLVGMKELVRVLDFVVPNLGLLDLKEAFTYGDVVTAASVASRATYGAAYAATVLALAAVLFSRKDIR